MPDVNKEEDGPYLAVPCKSEGIWTCQQKAARLNLIYFIRPSPEPTKNLNREKTRANIVYVGGSKHHVWFDCNLMEESRQSFADPTDPRRIRSSHTQKTYPFLKSYPGLRGVRVTFSSFLTTPAFRGCFFWGFLRASPPNDTWERTSITRLRRPSFTLRAMAAAATATIGITGNPPPRSVSLGVYSLFFAAESCNFLLEAIFE
jgi:hypothetical protein